MEKESIEELGITNVQRSFNWNSNFLRCMGIWPLKNYVPLFLFFFIYLIIHCSLRFVQLLMTEKTVDNVLVNLAENIELAMTLTKVTITRVRRGILGKLFTEIKEYALTEKYETEKEKLTFLYYTKLPLYFLVIIAFSMGLAEVLYYVTRVCYGFQIGKQNNSMGYELPYNTLEHANITDVSTYAMICAYQIMFIPCVVLGYVGFDYMFINLSIQVIAQFAILSCKVQTVLNSCENFRKGMKELVLRHYRLIRLTEELENTFTVPIMQQLLGTTLHICFSGYYLVMSNESEDILIFTVYILYVFSVTSTLFIYCFIGECFIQESTNFGKAIYDYEWYNLSATEARFFLICMIRTQKPQCLTSGKFAILSLSIFTDILKTSMGYLSVLRTFM